MFSISIGVAEAVQHDDRAGGGEGRCDAETDAAGRAGHHRHAPIEWPRIGGAGQARRRHDAVIGGSPSMKR